MEITHLFFSCCTKLICLIDLVAYRLLLFAFAWTSSLFVSGSYHVMKVNTITRHGFGRERG